MIHVYRCHTKFASRLPLYTLTIIWHKWALSTPGDFSRRRFFFFFLIFYLHVWPFYIYLWIPGLGSRYTLHTILHTWFYIYIHVTTAPPPLPPPPSLAPFPLSLNIILNSINVQAHNRSNHISSPPLPTSSILFCVFQFCYVLLQYLFLCFRNILFH